MVNYIVTLRVEDAIDTSLIYYRYENDFIEYFFLLQV